MGYVEDESMVRVDIFKPSGKWHMSIGLNWLVYDGSVPIHKAFALSLHDWALQQRIKAKDSNLWNFDDEYSDWFAVCLEPYHQYSHPITIKLGRVKELVSPNKE